VCAEEKVRKFLFRLSGNLRVRLINDGDRPYLERYYLGTIFGKRFYLHRFVDSDPDRGLHDHPWDRAWSFILSGRYLEERRSGLRTVRWFNRLDGDSFHRVILTEGECWSLFIHTVPEAKKWGFLQIAPFGKMASWKEYEYSREGSQKNWWKSALLGKYSSRQTLKN
jgi:hypothetical protein